MFTNTSTRSRTTLATLVLPAAFLLAAMGASPALAHQLRANQLSPDIGTFDPGQICSGSAAPAPTTGSEQSLRVSRLVIAAHAAGVRADR
jgi:hypothetical protein